MSDHAFCPVCNSPLLADGQCPQCLIRLGLDAPSVPDESHAPHTIGPYRILDKLGEGGMGVVYLAEQDAPIRRRVALKLIKLGLDTRQVIARFESERQALALMQHPNVAAVYDAGATEDGRPYFVMEYVEGVPITDFCDRNRLDIPARLRLFSQACDAIQHAHQKGIIHRDVKPSNVLVTSVDGPPAVKVIDFGVAKATTARLTEQTFFTQHGVLIGTPAYMSPEQADPFNPDVDTRTDVYSLGVLLYELAAGALPFDTSALLSAGYEEIRRKIREEDPPRPSTRVSSLGDASMAAARNRRTDPRTLQMELRGDLDWVVMRALDKDRARRYASPSEFAADVQRYLLHQPIEARPPQALYRLKKMVQRHRVAVVAAALVALSLTGGGVLAAWQAVRATRAEREARQEATTAREVATFLQGLFEGADPTVARGDTITARELLERGRQRIERDLSAQPDVRARLLALLGDIHRRLGMYPEGTTLLKDALATRERVQGPAHRDVAEATFLLGRVTVDGGDYVAAEKLFERARRILEALPPSAQDPGLLASVINDQARIAFHYSKYDRAGTLYRESLSIQERVLGPSHPDVASSLRGLGAVLYRRGEFANAEEAYRRALAIVRERLGADHPVTGQTLSVLASTLGQMGRDTEAEPLMLEAVRIQEKAFGPMHSQVASELNNLASLYGRQGRQDKAAEIFERTAVILQHIFGEAHQNVAIAFRNLGLTYSLVGEYARSDTYLRRALEIDEKNLGPSNTAVLWDLVTLGNLERKKGDLNEAVRLFTLARERGLASSTGTKNPEYERALEGLGAVAIVRRNLGEADRLYSEALAIKRAANGDNNVTLAGPLEGLGAVLVARGNGSQAIEPLGRALALREATQGKNHPALSETLRKLASAYRLTGRSDDAEKALVRAMTIVEKAHGPDHPEVAASAQALGELLVARGDADGARAQFSRALAIRRKMLGNQHPDTLASAAALR
jgi:serine/threonine protein kinase/tetratricopeptide (TPR) repeat protein